MTRPHPRSAVRRAYDVARRARPPRRTAVALLAGRCDAGCCSCTRRRSRTASGAAGGPLARRRPGRLAELPDGEAAKNAAVAAFCWSRSRRRRASRAATPSWASAGERPPISPVSWPPPGCAAFGRAGADDAARHGRRRGRRQDRHQRAGGQEPRRCLPSAGRGPLRSDLLATLPRADYVSGLAEVVKCGSLPTPSSSTSSRPTPRPPRGPPGEAPPSWSSARYA